MVALLNDPTEADVCKAMLEQAEARLGVLHQALTAQVLDREAYLQKIGAAKELELLIEELHHHYDRNFNV